MSSEFDFIQNDEAFIDVGKLHVQALKRGECFQQRWLFHDRFQDQSISLFDQHHLIRLKLKIPWNSDSLIATVAKKGNAPRYGFR